MNDAGDGIERLGSAPKLVSRAAGSIAAGTAMLRFLAKSERRSPLRDDDREVLLALPAIDRTYVAGETVLKRDIPATHCAFVSAGVLGRVKLLTQERREIVALHLPGDAVDLGSIMFTVTDHALMAHSRTHVSWVAHSDLLDVSARRPAVAKALWFDTLAESSIAEAWIVNVGGRSARDRLAHLILELAARLGPAGAPAERGFELPLKQLELADALGLSLAQLHRSLRSLRDVGYLTFRHHTVVMHDRAGLEALCGFDPTYLRLDGTGIRRPHRTIGA